MPASANTSHSAGDALSGQDGVDVIFGQDGDDKVSGGSGDDYVEGDGGADAIHGDVALVPAEVVAAPAAIGAWTTPEVERCSGRCGARTTSPVARARQGDRDG